MFLASVYTMPEQFENGTKFDDKKVAERLDVKEMYLHSKDRSLSRSKYVEKGSVLNTFECSNDAVFKMCR